MNLKSRNAHLYFTYLHIYSQVISGDSANFSKVEQFNMEVSFLYFAYFIFNSKLYFLYPFLKKGGDEIVTVHNYRWLKVHIS